ncbi:MAG: OsmC family protein [Longimicrobiales bacterium]
MADVSVALRWRGEGLRFEGGAPDAAAVDIDGDGASGASPMQALLLALAGCTGADVVEILGKMRLSPAGLTVRVDGDRAPEPPRRYTSVRIVYELEGIQADEEPKVRRAVELSQEKYCSVMHTFRRDVRFETDVVLRAG